MRRILLVDDDPMLLDGLEGLFFDRMDEWEVETAEGGARALELLEEAPFDLMITDMRMPQMSGAELLSRARDSYPDMLFFILSGHAQEEELLRAMALAHRYLAKPCAASELFDAIESGFRLLETLERGQFRSRPDLFAQIGSAFDGVRGLLTMIDNERTTFRDAARVIGENVFLATRVIQVANSALYAGARSCHHLEAAIARIGFPVLKSILIEVELRQAFCELDLASFQIIQNELRLIASVASLLSSQQQQSGEHFLNGLLQGVGMFAMALEVGEDYAAQCERCTRAELVSYERDTFGVSHHIISAHLLQLWGFEPDLAEMIEGIGEAGWELREPTDARFIQELAMALLDKVQAEETGAPSEWDEDAVIERVGLARWEHWVTEVSELVNREEML